MSIRDVISNKDTFYPKEWKDDIEALKDLAKKERENEREVNERLKKLERLQKEKYNDDIM